MSLGAVEAVGFSLAWMLSELYGALEVDQGVEELPDELLLRRQWSSRPVLPDRWRRSGLVGREGRL